MRGIAPVAECGQELPVAGDACRQQPGIVGRRSQLIHLHKDGTAAVVRDI